LYAVGIITSQELADRIQAGSAPFILDVRTVEEFAEGHVPGAVNIPVSDLANRAGEIMPYQQEEIVVYCAVGPRAYFVGMLMEKNGFTGVLDLKGHMHEWVSRGHPTLKVR
jgi:rhodanese-related sulfurtransferase